MYERGGLEETRYEAWSGKAETLHTRTNRNRRFTTRGMIVLKARWVSHDWLGANGGVCPT
jgi:hypothetical protein